MNIWQYAFMAVVAVFGYVCGRIAGARAGHRSGYRTGRKAGYFWAQRGRQ